MVDQYIVRSGDGYLIGWSGEIPTMTTDPIQAGRVDRDIAEEAINKLAQAGFFGELVRLNFRRISLAERERFKYLVDLKSQRLSLHNILKTIKRWLTQ